MASSFTRRDFLAISAKGFGAAVISSGLVGCNSTDEAAFLHSIASGDPTQNSVILWTRVTPKQSGTVTVAWEVSLDDKFTQLVTTGNTSTNKTRDYTVKVDAIGLEPGQKYFYRFKCDRIFSAIGQTKTLPKGNIDQVKLAVLSCANFPSGYFNVYKFAGEIENIDAILHLGDYIYEHGRNSYASENAVNLDREVLPKNELLSLSDYRARYAQYRSDPDLSTLHAQVPFINVWDDHEIANDTWVDGAANHNEEEEGSFSERKMAAIQAYFEWLPIRPWQPDEYNEIYRSFAFGDLIDLHMLDTRVLARDEQLYNNDYFDYSTNTIDKSQLMSATTSPNRTLLGQEQLQWLQSQLLTSTGKWQVLGQQVLMNEMLLPEVISTGKRTLTEFGLLNELADIEEKILAEDNGISAADLQFFSDHKHRLTPSNKAMLKSQATPYNLDAWDGYAYDREVVLATAKSVNANLVVLTGDTHNAWACDLADSFGDIVGVEFATSSVSSPGVEYLEEDETINLTRAENGVMKYLENLQYCNLNDRGFMVITFTHEKVQSDWHYVDTILSTSFNENIDRKHSVYSAIDVPQITKL
jgi:alkaline phosphatase D